MHQFCRIGRHAIIGGYSVITQDVLPFSTTVSEREVKVFGANKTGLERRGFAAEAIDALHKAFRLLTALGAEHLAGDRAHPRGSAGQRRKSDELIAFIRRRPSAAFIK